MKFDDSSPIWKQIISYLKIMIINGKYPLGSKIPPVRELSMELKVNPNTTQRALAELEDDGLIYTERTNGKYVTDDKSVIDSARNQLIKGYIDSFYSSMSDIGISKEEAKKILLDREDNNGNS